MIFTNSDFVGADSENRKISNLEKCNSQIVTLLKCEFNVPVHFSIFLKTPLKIKDAAIPVSMITINVRTIQQVMFSPVSHKCQQCHKARSTSDQENISYLSNCMPYNSWDLTAHHEYEWKPNTKKFASSFTLLLLNIPN